jgi:hypothetical protein
MVKAMKPLGSRGLVFPRLLCFLLFHQPCTALSAAVLMMIGSREVVAGTHRQCPFLVAMTGGYLVAWQACHKRGAQLPIPSRHGFVCDLPKFARRRGRASVGKKAGGVTQWVRPVRPPARLKNESWKLEVTLCKNSVR